MVFFPNCKINLGLNIIEKRTDGFHNLETVFYPVYKLFDALEIIPSNEFSVEITGTDLHIPFSENIVYKAYQLLKTDFDLPTIKIHLHKRIPHGAGLGGGSADASFMLRLLNNYFNLKIDDETLKKYAEQLGSDCPFFIDNTPAFATQKGEKLTPIPLDLSAYHLLLIKPNFEINTAFAFSKITPQQPEKSIRQIIQQDINTWKNELTNDFEKPVFEKYPELQNIKNELYKAGAIFASMSGTGSTLFGFFENKIDTKILEQNNAQVFWV